VRFTVTQSRFDEATLSHLSDPAEYVQRAAAEKAGEVARRRAGLILGADTDVVAPDGTILGKPGDDDDAARLLRLLSGATHSVFSGVALLLSDGKNVTRRDVRVVETRITFGPLTDEAIRAYVATGEPRDKAGAYGIQGGALAFATKVDGDLSNVIGLPLWTVGQMLAASGVPLWRFEEAPPPDAD
jgi:septum formation protein